MSNKVTNMTLDIAISNLKSCKTVTEWNQTRQSIKRAVTTKEWMNSYLPAIDASGLIVEVLGQDEPKARR